MPSGAALREAPDGGGAWSRHPVAMTHSTAQPPTPHPASAAGAPRLRRRASERVAAGVASGLGDYLNVDPLLIRVIFVGLVLFDGAGFFIYLAAWLLIPVEGRDVSIVEGWIRRLWGGGAPGTVGWIVLGIIGVVVLVNVLPSRGGPPGVDTEIAVRHTVETMVLVLALVVIVGGVLLVRRSAAGGPSSGGGDGGSIGEPTAGVPPPAYDTVERSTRRTSERSPLGLYSLGTALLAVGALAAVDRATAADILPRYYAGVALAVLGAGVLVGAWWGRARWLIVVAVLIAPIALALSFISVPLDERWGNHRVAPTRAAELRDEYRLAAGRLTLDLTNLPRSAAERHVSGSVGIGRLLVILPEGARADISAEVGFGRSDLLGARQQGTGLTDHEVRTGTGAAFVLDLAAGMGEVLVRTASTGSDAP